jgi:hypothetical protein
MKPDLTLTTCKVLSILRKPFPSEGRQYNGITKVQIIQIKHKDSAKQLESKGARTRRLSVLRQSQAIAYGMSSLRMV